MKIMLCGRPKGCCPSVEKKEDGRVIIKDEHTYIKFTAEQWAILKEKINLGVV